MSDKKPIDHISALAVDSVSQFRKAQIENQLKNVKYGATPEPEALTSLGRVVGSNIKTAQVLSSTSYRGPGDTVKQVQSVYSPLWLNSNLNLPRDRVTINAWCRAFYALNPFVHNAINLHSTYPISKLNIKCAHKTAEKFFASMIEEIDLMNICVQIAQEYWLLGEAFVYADLDQNKGKWSRLVIQNPDYMMVKPTVIPSEPVIMLKPDENLKRVVSSNKPADIEQRKLLNPYIVEAVKRGNAIEIPSFNISYLARKISPYETRGTGLPVTVFRQLALFDILRESKYVQADAMINPLTLVKVGNGDFKPTYADLEAYREQFEQAESDKDFKIFTHDGVAVEVIGRSNGVHDINADITQLIKEMYIGLQVPSSVMDGGGDTTYANAGVALDLLRQRYMQFRNMMAHWLKTKIFAPISKIQEFYEYEDGEKKLIVPEIEWNHMSLFDTGDYIQILNGLAQGEGEAKRASIHSMYRSLGLDWDSEQRNIRKELIQGTIAKKEKEILDKMSLTAIKALSEDTEITEALETEEGSVPGQDGGAPGGLPPMPGGDMGLPPLPGGDMGGGPPPGAPPP